MYIIVNKNIYYTVSEAISIKIEQQETRMEIPEEEEEYKPDCTGGMDTKSGIMGHVDFTALPGPSGEMQCNDSGRLSLKEDKPLHNADCVVLGRKHQRSEAQKGHKGNILKMLKDNIVEKPLQQRIYSVVAAVLKAARQCKRRQMATKDRIKKIEHLMQVGVCQVLENLPTPLHAMISAQMRNEGKPIYGRRFTEEEKILALSIYKQSPKAFRYLSKLFLLPSIETLRKLLSHIPLRAGICDNVFRELEERSESFPNEKSRYALLLFDEIKLSPSLVYNPSMDIVEGFVDSGFSRSLDIADHAMVWMLKGIDGVRPWKQPVAYTFCRGISSVEIIVRMFKELVRRACQAGIVVVASVCDQGSTNCKAIQCLIDFSKRNAFQQSNPLRHDIIVIDENEIVPLFDPPHLLKCMRNNLLTKDLQFHLADNLPRVAKWSHVEDLYFIDSSNASSQDRVLKKLTAKHVVVDKARKMKVKYCAQVFSQSVGSVMTLMSRSKLKSVCGTREMPLEGVDTARFIHFMNDIFDSVNSSRPLPIVDMNCERPNIWDVGINVFRSMKFIKRKFADKERPLVVCNWIRTLQNFKYLTILLGNLGFSHFIGRNFNQDPLENFFGQIRQHGTRNSNPTCTAFHGYYRTLLLNSYSQLVIADTNCESEESANFLISLKKYLSPTPAASMIDNSTLFLNYNVSTAAESTVLAVVQYVSRDVLKKNTTCKFCLALVFEINVSQGSSMHAACRSLITQVVSICLANMPHIAHTPNLIATLKLCISEHVNFKLTCSEHGNSLITYVIHQCIIYVVKNYIGRVNRVINGSEEPASSDPLITRAFHLSRK